MANERPLHVYTDLDVKKDINASGSVNLKASGSFSNVSIVTSSAGMYNLDTAIHSVDTAFTSVLTKIKNAYDLVRFKQTGSFDANGNVKVNLTSLATSGSVYFSTASIHDVDVQVLVDTEGDSHYKNDLLAIDLFNSASALWVNVDAPTAASKPYRLLAVNELLLPLATSVAGVFQYPIRNIGGEGGGGGGGGTTLVNGLLAYWSLNGNSNDSLNTYNGTDTNITYGSTYGVLSEGAYFNGSTSKIVVGAIPLDANNWTMALWVKPNTLNGSQRVLSYHGNGPTILIYGSQVELVHGGVIDRAYTYGTLTASVWQHIVIARSGSVLDYYKNGQLVEQQVNWGPASSYTADSDVRIGNSTAYNEPYHGAVDEVGIWNRGLTSAEVAMLYSSGSAKSYSTF